MWIFLSFNTMKLIKLKKFNKPSHSEKWSLITRLINTYSYSSITLHFTKILEKNYGKKMDVTCPYLINNKNNINVSIRI